MHSKYIEKYTPPIIVSVPKGHSHWLMWKQFSEPKHLAITHQMEIPLKYTLADPHV